LPISRRPISPCWSGRHERLAPEELHTVLDFDFQGTDFHWFDLQRLG
jgi:hypothetical protein